MSSVLSILYIESRFFYIYESTTVSKISPATKSFFESFLKGQRSFLRASVPERQRKGPRRRSDVIGEGVERERDFVVSPRFRFSCGRKQKERGSLCGLPLFVSFSRRDGHADVHRKPCMGRGVLSRVHLTPAPLVLHLRIHQNVRASCTCTRAPRIFSPFMADGSRSRELLRPVF